MSQYRVPSDESGTPAHVYVYISSCDPVTRHSPPLRDMLPHYVLLVAILRCACEAAVHESGSERRPLLMRCVDPDCSVPISEGRTMVNYPRPDNDFLSFIPDSRVVILGKPADSVSALAYAEIADEKGLVPLNLIREEKVIGKIGLTVPWPLVVRNALPSDSTTTAPVAQATREPANELTAPQPDPEQTAANDTAPMEQVDEQKEDNITSNIPKVDEHPSISNSPAPRQDLPAIPAQSAPNFIDKFVEKEAFNGSTEINVVAEKVSDDVDTERSQSLLNLTVPSDVTNDSKSSATFSSTAAIAINDSHLQPSLKVSGDAVSTLEITPTDTTTTKLDIVTESPASAADRIEPVSTETPVIHKVSEVMLPEITERVPIQSTLPIPANIPNSIISPVPEATGSSVSDQPLSINDGNDSSDDFKPPPSLAQQVAPIPISVEEAVLVADEAPAVAVDVSLDPPFVTHQSTVYELPLPDVREDFTTRTEVTTLSSLVGDSVTSSSSDLYVDTTQTVPSNSTDMGSSAGDVRGEEFADPVLPPASDSRQAFESVVPIAYLDTIRLYLSCLDFLPSPLHEFMERNNVTPHGVILTLVIGLLWIVMMVAQMVISRNSRHTLLEGKIERNASIISKLKTERSAIEQKYASENEKLSRLEGSLSDSHQRLVCAEDACRKAEAQNRTLVSQLKELEEKLEQQQQVKQSLHQEQERLAKESQDWKSRASRSAADAASLEQSCQQKEAELQSLTQENDSLVHSRKDLNARQELLQQQILQLQSDMERLTASNMEQDVRIDELSNENDLLKAQIQEKDNLNNALKEMLQGLDAAKSRLIEDETDDCNHDHESEPKIDLMELAHVRAEQKALLRQRTDLEQSLSDLRREKDSLSKELADQQEFVRSSAQRVEEAVAAKEEAEKRLQVLEKYFNGREVELQRELGALQVRRQQKEEDANSLEKRLMDLEGEKDSYQSQLESMRRELSESERNFKSQLANMEKRAHENWVAARNSEREASDLRRDAVFLRQQLTMMASSGSIALTDDRSDKSVNGTMIDFATMPLPPPPPPPPPMALSQHSVMHPEFLYQNHGYAPLAPEAMDLSGSRPESVIRDTASVPIDCDAVAAAGGGGSSASSLYEYPFMPPPPPPPAGAFPNQFLMSSMFPQAGYPPDEVWDTQHPTQSQSISGAHQHHHPPHHHQQQPPPSHSSGPPV